MFLSLQMFPSNGLASILKKRVCGQGTESLNSQKNSKRFRVRFREPDDAFEQGTPFRFRLHKPIIYSALC